MSVSVEVVRVLGDAIRGTADAGLLVRLRAAQHAVEDYLHGMRNLGPAPYALRVRLRREAAVQVMREVGQSARVGTPGALLLQAAVVFEAALSAGAELSAARIALANTPSGSEAERLAGERMARARNALADATSRCRGCS